MKEMFSNVPDNAPAVVLSNEYSGEVTVLETVLLSLTAWRKWAFFCQRFSTGPKTAVLDVCDTIWWLIFSCVDGDDLSAGGRKVRQCCVLNHLCFRRRGCSLYLAKISDVCFSPFCLNVTSVLRERKENV